MAIWAFISFRTTVPGNRGLRWEKSEVSEGKAYGFVNSGEGQFEQRNGLDQNEQVYKERRSKRS